MHKFLIASLSAAAIALSAGAASAQYVRTTPDRPFGSLQVNPLMSQQDMINYRNGLSQAERDELFDRCMVITNPDLRTQFPSDVTTFCQGYGTLPTEETQQ